MSIPDLVYLNALLGSATGVIIAYGVLLLAAEAVRRVRRPAAERPAAADAPVRAGAGSNPADTGLPAETAAPTAAGRVVPPAAADQPTRIIEVPSATTEAQFAEARRVWAQLHPAPPQRRAPEPAPHRNAPKGA